MEYQQAKHHIKAEIRIWHGNEMKKNSFLETLQLSSKFIIAIDHIYENSNNASKMVTM